MNRRQFVAISTGSTLLPAFATEKAAWYERPMRWAQLAFVEDDPGN